jgi:hypothetical protein
MSTAFSDIGVENFVASVPGSRCSSRQAAAPALDRLHAPGPHALDQIIGSTSQFKKLDIFVLSIGKADTRLATAYRRECFGSTGMSATAAAMRRSTPRMASQYLASRFGSAVSARWNDG